MTHKGKCAECGHFYLYLNEGLCVDCCFMEWDKTVEWPPAPGIFGGWLLAIISVAFVIGLAVTIFLK